jgi:CRP-like cAMP-binding protein
MFDLLLQQVSRYINLNKEEEKILLETLTYREVPPQFKLVDYQKICQEIYFLKSGCIRMYYLKDGEELTGFLFTEGMFFNSFESFIRQTPSLQIFETVEACELLVLSKDKLEVLYNKVPKMNEFFRKLLEERFINAQKVVATFVLDKPEERYLGILASNPSLLQRFPQNVLASYLGITPVSLSRMRKRIAERK